MDRRGDHTPALPAPLPAPRPTDDLVDTDEVDEQAVDDALRLLRARRAVRHGVDLAIPRQRRDSPPSLPFPRSA